MSAFKINHSLEKLYSMSAIDALSTVFLKGRLLTTIDYNSTFCSLYSFQTCFVEVVFSREDYKLKAFSAFEINDKAMQKYIDQIDIKDLDI